MHARELGLLLAVSHVRCTDPGTVLLCHHLPRTGSLRLRGCFPRSPERDPREHSLPPFLERSQPADIPPRAHSQFVFHPLLFSVSNSAGTAASTRGLGFPGDCQTALQRGRMDLHSHCWSPVLSLRFVRLPDFCSSGSSRWF